VSKYRTAESVSPKHPDKLCDQISDAILDACLAKEPKSRVAVEAAGGHGKVFITGEVTSDAQINVKKIARRIAGNVTVVSHIAKQSPGIAAGVDRGGAGDQGIMVGYATDQTPDMLPPETVLARSLNQFVFEYWPYDGKTQITLRDGKIVAVVASFQHAQAADLRGLIAQWISDKPKSRKYKVHANPSGDWTQGGFDADAGLTGRKLVVDNYGPHIPVGGGAFSGKDPSKVDRSAAYMARRIAVDNLRAAKAEEVFCYLAYAIGVAEPVEATLLVDGKSKPVTGYDLTPAGIRKYLGLDRPIYEQTARWGHFGHGFAWDN